MPSTYQLFRFMSRTVELFFKLPLETVLRRGQMAVLTQEHKTMKAQGIWTGELDTVVKVGEYRGVLGTMWLIAKEEGLTETSVLVKGSKKGRSKEMRGQGVQGLWRGWRVGMWGLVGMWGSSMLNGGASGGEF
jgi:fusion and transport protein UGO1